MNRPPDSRSRSSAAIAVSSGLRTNAIAMPDASSMSSSHAAAAPSAAHGGAKICGTSTPDTPAARSAVDLVADRRPGGPAGRNAQWWAARTRSAASVVAIAVILSVRRTGTTCTLAGRLSTAATATQHDDAAGGLDQRHRLVVDRPRRADGDDVHGQQDTATIGPPG